MNFFNKKLLNIFLIISIIFISIFKEINSEKNSLNINKIINKQINVNQQQQQNKQQNLTENDINFLSSKIKQNVKNITRKNDENIIIKLPSSIYSTSNSLSPPIKNFSKLLSIIFYSYKMKNNNNNNNNRIILNKNELDNEQRNSQLFNNNYNNNNNNNEYREQKKIKNISRKRRELLLNNNDNDNNLISYNGSVTDEQIFTTKSNSFILSSSSSSSSVLPSLLLLQQASIINNTTTDNYINDSLTTNLYENGYCDETEDENCIIDHNTTCVGEPVYCNLTYSEYMDLLYDYIYPTTPEWILICSHLVVFVMGLVGNALVCIAVYTNHSMRTVTNIFIVNLAVADFFVILFCLPPTVIWDVTETWFMGKAMCKVVLYFQTVSVTVSVLTLTFISIDRWYAICFPLRYVSTNERAIGSIAFIWIVALLGDLPEFLVLTTKKRILRFGSNLFTQCEATWDKNTEKIFYILKFTILYSLPLLFMSVAYFQIVRVLWKSDTIPGHRESRNQTHICKNLRSSCGPTANSSTMGQLRARRKAAKMLVAVVLMFAGCYFPVHVLNILRYTIDIGQNEVIAVLSLFSHWLCYANSAVNPVIYNFMSGKFRREFKNALEKCRCFGSVRRVEDRSLYHSAPGTRTNNISPSSRSNYQLTSVRDITRGQTHQTSFMENGGNGHSHHLNHHHNHHHHPLTSPMIMEDRIQPTIIDGNT